MLQPGILTLDSLNLNPGSVTDGITLKTLFASLHEVFQPGIIGAGADTFPTAEVSKGCVTPEAFRYDADLLFSAELAASDSFDIPDESFRFFISGFSLPELV